MKLASIVLGTALAGALTGGAHADLYQMGVVYGDSNTSSVSVGAYGNPWTTPITMTMNGKQIVVYCDDLNHDFSIGSWHDFKYGLVTVDGLGNPLLESQSNKMGVIADLGKADLAHGDEYGAIAAQAAIWAVEYFYTDPSVVSSSVPEIEADLLYFLSIPENPNGGWAHGFIALDGSQSQISGVPETSTWTMIALGFAGVAYGGLYRGRRERSPRYAV